MRLLFYPIRYKFKQYAFINICCLLIILMSIFIISSFENTFNNSVHIPRNDLYILDDSDKLPVDDFEKLFTLDGSLDKLPSVEVDTGLDFYNIDIPSFASYNLKENYYEYSQGDFETRLYPDYSSNTNNLNKMPNATYQIDQILTGNYPKESNQLLIGEYVASSYMADNNLTSYDQLIGQEMKLKINRKTYSFEICGVYSGGEALITSSSNSLFSSYKRPASYSYYKTFRSKKDKQRYISDNSLNEDNYLDSSINTINFQLLTKFILLAIMNLIFMILMILILRGDYIVIKYYKQYKAYLILVIPIINILVLNYVFVKLIL